GWEQLLEAEQAQRTCTLPDRPARPGVLPGPGGAVLVRPTGIGEWWIGAGRPEAALFAARFASLLSDMPPISEALREVLSRGTSPRWTLREIVDSDPVNPNAGLHPVLTEYVLDAHAPEGGLCGLNVAGD